MLYIQTQIRIHVKHDDSNLTFKRRADDGEQTRKIVLPVGAPDTTLMLKT